MVLQNSLPGTQQHLRFNTPVGFDPPVLTQEKLVSGKLEEHQSAITHPHAKRKEGLITLLPASADFRPSSQQGASSVKENMKQ